MPRASDGSIKGSDDSPLTTFEEEIRAKRAIKMAEKDHEDNLKRAREIAQIGKELNDNLKDKFALDRDSIKKVERLEKLTKKVRGEAGGEDEEVEIPNRPSDLHTTVAQIAEASESLSKNVIDTPRQVVSASVIGKANVLLELIKMVRTFARP
jgi:septation ring formation regulator EzrA